MENNEYKVIEEHVDYYLIENKEGIQRKALKIRKSEIQKINDDLNEKVAKNIEIENFLELISKLENILNDVPTVDKYVSIATELTLLLEKCYGDVGNPNQFHHPIKNIDLNIYGKAGTFIKQVVQLYESMLEVAKIMKDMGKIKEIQTSNKPYQKFIVLARTSVPGSTNIYDKIHDLVYEKNNSQQIIEFKVENVFKVFTKIS